jgi:hypothetical protein
MAHRTARSGYLQLAERLNKFPQGAPPSDLLFRILRMLVSEREASLLALVPIKSFTARQAASAWRMCEEEAVNVLTALAERAMVIDIEGGEGVRYALPPPMAGFIEFSLMRVRGDIDQKALSELLYQYLNVEEDFIRELFAAARRTAGAPSSRSRRCPPGKPSRCWTTSAPAR